MLIARKTMKKETKRGKKKLLTKSREVNRFRKSRKKMS